jgi:phosphoglycolate phosphatase-like HAD superfamily hydrolase
MSRAFQALFGIPDAFGSIPLPGRTDAWLLASALEIHGLPRDDAHVLTFRDAYLRDLALELAQPPPADAPNGILPGVRPLLETLASRHTVHLGLLTGNYELAARMKLEHFDLWRYFSSPPLGAFGDHTLDRNLLLPRVMAQVAASGGPFVTPTDAVVIGDTPLDVAVAKHGGARSVAVATGNHSADALRATGADVVFEDLSNTHAVLACLIA